MPVEGESPAVRVSVDDPEPPAGTRTGLGKLTVTSAGATLLHAAARLIVELKPFTELKRIVVDLATSGVNVRTAGEG